MATIINLTPHAVNLIGEDGTTVLASIPSSGVARATQTDEMAGSVEIGGIEVPVVKTKFGEVIDLPEPDSDTIYVVSLITAQAAVASGRGGKDLLYPSGVPVRGPDGQILGVRALARAE